MIRVKNKRSAPAIIAPIMLVAANSIARRITDVKTAPSIPVVIRAKLEQTQSPAPASLGEVRTSNAR